MKLLNRLRHWWRIRRHRFRTAFGDDSPSSIVPTNEQVVALVRSQVTVGFDQLDAEPDDPRPFVFGEADRCYFCLHVRRHGDFYIADLPHGVSRTYIARDRAIDAVVVMMLAAEQAMRNIEAVR